MIRSMTGFGRNEASDGLKKITVEMKAVNHRYLDINIKIPKKLSFFESSIRNLLKKYLERGKVDIFISYEDLTESKLSLKYNSGLAKEYLGYLNQMSEELGLRNDVSVSVLSRYPEVFVMEEQELDEEEFWKLLEKAISGAVQQLAGTREKEGESLKTDLMKKLDEMSEQVQYIEERSPDMLKEYRAKLEEKVRALLEDTQIDENRMAAEVVLYADKICVDEEIVRLKSHVDHMRETLNEGVSVGRKMDFIAQEMNREANTILSKANDLTISNKAIDLKTEIEKVREQIQNIE
ncbi:YicC/YloC family endoribonuclease [Anaerobium acetethylicum]|uniref:TIGR00255 family protein n=1 Tax=Anaerobium acetethylicum TaxID=1619234 RepID=A0A1D3TNJ7_9FIRM|nr:YicC/YloC family endoribonuclease [Anaerobium acetethylicum]SCP94904.1 TIGR00255 family protein [Anaerobium acetethylicum]